MGRMKPIAAKWIMDAVHYIYAHPVLICTGFRDASITDAISELSWLCMQLTLYYLAITIFTIGIFTLFICNLNDKIILQSYRTSTYNLLRSWLNSMQFPGLISILLQEKCYNLQGGSAQIIHCLRRHYWISASNIGCNENSVNVHDSLFPDVDITTCWWGWVRNINEKSGSAIWY